ncbi:MAG: glycosyltransferase family 2 protein [Bacteroidales bacterium]
MKRVAIVILNWNGKELLKQFLPGVAEHSKHPKYVVDVIVADNNSTDESLLWLTKNYPYIRVISLDKNYGFAGGYNRALKQVKADYFVLLNSDVEVRAGWLTPLLNFMEHTPNAAACMPKIIDYKNPERFEYAGAAGGFLDFLGYPFCRGRILNTIENDNGQYDDAKEVFWATGACMLIRAKEFIAAGGFDEDFFAHMEEIDLCWRLKRQGYSIWCIPASRVFHVGGATLSNINPRKVYYNHRNNLLMLLKNLSARSVIPLISIRILLDLASAFGYAISGKPGLSISVIKAHSYFFKKLKETIVKRKQLKYPRIKLFRGSILIHYFVKRNRRFSDLPRKVYLGKH